MSEECPSSAGSGSSSVFSGVFIAEEVDEVGGKVLEDNTVVMYRHYWRPLCRCP